MKIQDGIIWVSGYSASGKTTIGRKVESKLKEGGYSCIFLDGDDLRAIFANKWGYNKEDRIELAKVYFHLSSHLASQGFIVIISAVAMYDEVRAWMKENVSHSVEIFLNVPDEERRRRDSLTKGIYQKDIDFENLYDFPKKPDLTIENHGDTNPEFAAQQIVNYFLSQDGQITSDRGRKKHWNNYYGKGSAPNIPSSFAQHVNSQLTSKQSILEVGCGNGRDASFFASRGHTVSALDLSKSAIDYCIENYSKQEIKFSVGTINSLGKEDSTQFDVIYSRFCLHAMTPSEEIEFWNIAAKLLSKNGYIFVECRSINDPLARKGEVLSPTERIAGHYRRFIVLDELTKRVENTGLQVIQSSECDGLAKYKDDNPVVIRLSATKT
ncbi:adenylyl-sulfate kinase [Kiloniella sp.]|uniref:adenylyl-sulfate kinase n=1 Tax=Kiloniella sp. TaxID=1938587 RepID=UPI003A958C15